MNKVIFSYGTTITQDEMAPNSIYLDGYCRGPHINNETKSYSFDHHADCSRFATLSTCEQVLLALELGLNPEGMDIYINDLDADGSLSLWLLLNPEMIEEDGIEYLVKSVGFVDAHGPVRTPCKLHKCLSRNPSVAQTEAMLWEDQDLITLWYEGRDEALPEPFSFPPSSVLGFTQHGERLWVEGNFSTLYAVGGLVGLALVPGPDGTTAYTVGKKSDFVFGDIPALLAECNTIEDGWGGGSTIGGAPRNADGSRSRMSRKQVIQLFEKHCKPS